MYDSSSLKNFISSAILVAAIGALVAFGYSLFVPKVWQVSGKIVVVPSGSSPTAGANLFVEAANTAEMVSSPSFQKNVLGDNAGFFSSAEQFKNSSTVEINFAGKESDIQTIEDEIVKLPGDISSYARDIYGGSPFKYLILSDPEISQKPIRPNVLENVAWGSGIGFVLYFLYWLFVESFVSGKRAVEKEEEILPAQNTSLSDVGGPAPATAPFELAPAEPISYEPLPEPEPMPEPMPEIFPEQEIQPKKPVSQISHAPDNLPIMPARPTGGETPTASEYQEPSDEEVKERLNRLMRGEL